MSTLVPDPYGPDGLIAERRRKGLDLHDEVWHGVYIIMPNPDDQHQDLVGGIGVPFWLAIQEPGLGQVRPGVNVSDRIDDWKYNYRIPDVAVFLNGGTAECHDTFWFGGPDFTTEIVSADDRSRDKFDFYARVGTRELLLIDRDPWGLELHRLTEGEFALVGVSTVADPQLLTSEVIPFSFRLVAGSPRPQIEITHRDGRRWLA
jgi:Uma2 family endonuclease